jgi:hypothetical protein
MKKWIAGSVVAVALLAPLTTAKADTNDFGSFCTTGLALNFCGSVSVTATQTATGTNVTFTVLNTSGGPLGGDPAAVFNAIALRNVDIGAGVVGNPTVTAGGIDYSPSWEAQAGGSVEGFSVSAQTSTVDGIVYGISSACSGPPAERIYTGGSGCVGGLGSVTLSFDVTGAFFNVASAGLVINAGQEAGACVANCTTTVPEPASIVLVGTGLMALGKRASSWRRRKNDFVEV